MLGILEDLTIALKIVGILILFRWVADNIQHRLLATLVLLVGAYYLLFVEWDIFGVFVVLFIIVAMTGVGMFVQDLVFQYDSVAREQEGGMAVYLRRR